MLRDWLLTGASGACFVSFAWAVRGHFRRDAGMPRGMALLSAASLAAFGMSVWQLWSRASSPTRAGCALALFTASLSLFWWTVATTRNQRPGLAHSTTAPHRVETSGPYRLVRHPFYVSYMIFWLGTASAAGGLQWIAALILVAWYAAIAAQEERRFATSAAALAYASYRRRTGMLLPRPPRAGPRRDAASDSRELKGEQSAILARLAVFFAGLGLGSVNLFSFDFRHQFDLPMGLAYGWIVLSYLAWMVLSIAWIRNRDHDRFITLSTGLVMGLGVGWGLLVNMFASAATADQKGSLIGLIMALVSTPMLAVPVAVGLAFWAPIATLCTLAILYTLEPIHAGAVASFIGFLVFSLVGLLFLNKIIRERSIGRITLQHQHSALRIFLREYEQNASDWLWETDAGGRLHNVAPRMAQVLGRDAAMLERQPIASVFAVVTAAGAEKHELALSLQQKAAFRDLSVTLDRHGKALWVSLTGHPLYDEHGAFCGFRGVGADVTEARRSAERVAFMARHDGLTGLMNRQSFVERLEAACGEHRLALLLIDLDHFKPVNDDYGHSAGDAVLQGIGARLREGIRRPDLDGPGSVATPDVAARLGGDEFAVLLRISPADSAIEVAERLLRSLRQPIRFNGIVIHPHASVGIALSPEHASTASTLMKRADLALYEAKREGRNTCRMFEQGMDAAYRGRLRLQAELSTALFRDELFVAYQPIFDLQHGHIVSAEALVRWRHPTRGTVSAGEFIPLAEESGLIDGIGAFVLHEACRAAVDWGGTLPVVVNLSPRQLRSNGFLRTLECCLEKSGLPAALLGLEVTETVFLDLTERTMRQIEAIRGLGVRLILDDFGTGYSSLTYIRRFDFDGLKIDAAFTRDLPGSRKVGAIVRTIARLAVDLDMSLTAEGVESREQLIWLRANGVSLAQGFLLAMPQPAAQIADLLASGGGAASRILGEL